ncbi:MAG: mreD [Candidatus Protochlamydia sp.]|nr:mreD [Candidatus Protochlamydia sp.]
MLTFSTWLPQLPFFYFAPFLTYLFYHFKKIECLWMAALCGLCIDLLSSQMALGFYALNYVLTVEFLYPYKKHYFPESLSTLAILSFMFAIISTLLQVFLFYCFGQSIILSWEWVKNDLIQMPLWDALYAFLCFALPATFLHGRRVTRRSTTLLKRNNQP